MELKKKRFIPTVCSTSIYIYIWHFIYISTHSNELCISFFNGNKNGTLNCIHQPMLNWVFKLIPTFRVIFNAAMPLCSKVLCSRNTAQNCTPVLKKRSSSDYAHHWSGQHHRHAVHSARFTQHHRSLSTQIEMTVEIRDTSITRLTTPLSHAFALHLQHAAPALQQRSDTTC